MKYVLPTLSLLLPITAQAIELEFKSDLEYSRQPSRSVIQYKDDGRFDERDYSHKDSYESKTFLLLTQKVSDRFDAQARLGLQYQRTRDTRREYREDGSLKNDKSRTEWQRTPLIGLGFSYDIGRWLGGYHWRLDGYHDRLFDIEYRATGLAEDAKPQAGRGSGHESRLRLQGEYLTPVNSLFFIPRLQLKHERFGHWHNTARDRSEDAEQELQYEAGLWLSWIPPLEGWDVQAGPSWQRENKAEKQADESSWQWEDEERWQARVQLEYETPMPGFEFEFKIERDLNGPDRERMKYEAGLSYEF